MKTLLTIVALAGAMTLAGTTAERWAGGGLAMAQADETSACVQNCAKVRDWPEEQCMEYCKDKMDTDEDPDEEMMDEEMDSKPETEK